MRHKLILASCAMLWLPAMVGGWAVMARFTHMPGAQGTAPRLLPGELLLGGLPFGAAGRASSQSGASLQLSASPQLIVALHPQCSCSIATLHELARVLERSQVKPQVTLLVYTPGTRPPHWGSAEALFKAARPLHARVVEDLEGRMAAQAGAKTSGQVLLYSANGRLLFAGGVTDERGHEGESRAGNLLEAALDGRLHGEAAGASVFGCPITAQAADNRGRAGTAKAGGLL